MSLPQTISLKVQTWRPHLPAIIVNVLLAGWFFWLLDTHMLKETNGALQSFGSTWGDLPWHMSIIMGFVERGWGSLLTDPVYAGAKLAYPFVPEILPGLLVQMGLSLRTAIIATTWPLLIALTSLISLLTYRMSRSHLAAAVSPLLFCLGGSIVGTWYFMEDAYSSGSGIVTAFTTLGQSYANIFGKELYFTNVVADFLLPQRTMVFGLVLGLVALLFLWSYWTGGRVKNLFTAAACIGLLPLLHTHSFIALGIIAGTLAFTDVTQSLVRTVPRAERSSILRRWILSFVLIGVLALPQLLIILPTDDTSFLHFELGWMAKGSWLLFWLKNLGAYSLLIPSALILTAWHERKHAPQLQATDHRLMISRPYPITTFYVAFVAIFFTANIVVFQPWDWDNMKLFLWWFLGSIVLVLHAATLVQRWLRRNKPWVRFPLYLLLVACSFSLVSTGLLAARYETGTSLTLLSPADRELATYVRTHTSPEDIFLTSERHNHPITTLAGRRIFMGYGGWLWSHGINPTERTDEVRIMLSGAPGAWDLLHRNNIRYVAVEPSMLDVNHAFFDDNAQRVFENDAFTLYAIP